MSKITPNLAERFPIGARVSYPWGKGRRSGTVTAAPNSNGTIPTLLHSESANTDSAHDCDPGRLERIGDA